MREAVLHRTRSEAAALGERLARAIGADPADGQLREALAFPARFAASLGPAPAGAAASGPHPLDRLASLGGDGSLLADLGLLAILPEVHEGFAALCSLLHREAHPRATVALALCLAEAESPASPFAARDRVEQLLLGAPVAALGLVRAEGEGPWHGRDLVPCPGLADAALCRPLSPPLERVAGLGDVPGLGEWLGGADLRRAGAALATRADATVAVVGHTAEARACRVRALLGRVSLGAARANVAADSRAALRDVAGAAFLNGLVPWLDVAGEGSGPAADVPFAGPVIVTAPDLAAVPPLGRPMVVVPVEPLPATARRAMWSALLPRAGDDAAAALAIRFAVEPHEAVDVVADLALRQRLDGAPLGSADVAAVLRARTTVGARPGVRRVVPRASLGDVLLPPAPLAQLAEAVQRIERQVTVLDDWGFERGRHDRRGLKVLFHGGPGTGKTLAAEALAGALGLDLLVADVAGLVSKWIGETEKNLAAVFDVAERSRAVLLFDEADALFGRRTEVSDATDRYANLETAYLLQRLEAFTGVAVLATNMRSGLDGAFTRRFDEVVAFADPDAALRLRLWRLHLPAAAPLGDDVDVETLADWYPMTGAEIRNAALAAAYIAAGERRPAGILQRHLIAAVAREFEKMGRAFPGAPPPRAAVPGHAAAAASPLASALAS